MQSEQFKFNWIKIGSLFFRRVTKISYCVFLTVTLLRNCSATHPVARDIDSCYFTASRFQLHIAMPTLRTKRCWQNVSQGERKVTNLAGRFRTSPDEKCCWQNAVLRVRRACSLVLYFTYRAGKKRDGFTFLQLNARKRLTKHGLYFPLHYPQTHGCRQRNSPADKRIEKTCLYIYSCNRLLFGEHGVLLCF